MIQGFTVFQTAIGPVGLAWSDRGVARVQLPEETEAATRVRLLRYLPPGVSETPPPPAPAAAISRIVALLAGDRTDLKDIELDMDGVPDFHRHVYEATRAIPPGQIRSYGDVASALGAPGAARAVGQALSRNPFAPIVPCHRVMAGNAKPGGFSAFGGLSTKRQLLLIEGALPVEGLLWS